jgi:hypothetical protein
MPILLKLFLFMVIGMPGLIWSGTSLPFAFWTALVLSLISYGIDLVILSRTNNTFATTTDFLLLFALLWVAGTVFAQPFSLSGIFLLSFILSVTEYIYHDYLQRNSPHHSRHPG